MRPIHSLLAATTLILALPRASFAQFEDGPGPAGARIDKSETTRLKIGIEVTAEGGPCRGLRGSVPVPTEWPEQQVRIVEEKKTANVKRVEYRQIGAGAKQMVVEIAQVPDGGTASAYTIFEITRSSLLPPEDTSELIVPKRVDREMQVYLGASPQIETRNRKIVELAKQTGTNKAGWEKVEALYDITREKVQYKEGELKGAAKARRRRDRRLRGADVAIYRAMQEQRRAGADGVGARALLPGVLPGRWQGQGVLVPVSGGGDASVWGHPGAAADLAEGG